MDYIIIVAGGKGLRMGSDIPKQFLPVGGLPVLMHTIKRFREYSKEMQIILVLPEAQQDYWHSLCKEYTFNVEYMLANGGETRFHSVKNGLDMIPDDAEGVVGVHDGVRPFPALEVIDRCYETAKEAEAAVPVIPVVETLRHIINVNCDSVAVNNVAVNNVAANSVAANSITVPRNDYRLVQTPQTFTVRLLKKAYQQPYNDNFTDDASVVEALGRSITLVEGNRENIKITTPFDLTVAEALFNA